MEYPLRVEEYALVADLGGAGRFRGGLGLRRSVRPVDHTCEFNGVGERFRLAPWGIFGGEPGLKGRFQLQGPDGSRSDLQPKTGRMELRPDQTVIVETPGAGGYGAAAERNDADFDPPRSRVRKKTYDQSASFPSGKWPMKHATATRLPVPSTRLTLCGLRVLKSQELPTFG